MLPEVVHIVILFLNPVFYLFLFLFEKLDLLKPLFFKNNFKSLRPWWGYIVPLIFGLSLSRLLEFMMLKVCPFMLS